MLMMGTVKKVKLRHRARFGPNRSNHCRDMAIFLDFSKTAAVCHLGFAMRVFGPPTNGIWWSLSPCKICLECKYDLTVEQYLQRDIPYNYNIINKPKY